MTTVALGSIFIECNHFGGVPAQLESFRRCELLRGAEILGQTSGTVGGMLNVLHESNIDVAPLLVATACPAGPLTTECYQSLKSELLNRLQQSLPVEGVLLPLHGAAAADNISDLEGDLLTAVRECVGPQIPIIATLDLHAHVTETMVRTADALLAWETYPHADAESTGERGARLLLDTMAGDVCPTMALAKVPVIVGALNGHTSDKGPFADVMRLAKSFESRPQVLSTSAFLVHPYLDAEEMGGGGLVVTNNDPDLAERLATEIALAYWQRRFELEPELLSPSEAIQRGLKLDRGPVLLVETADCCGGGAAGDSVASLRELLRAELDGPALAPVVDPAAAAICHAADEGAEVTVLLGHQLDPKWGEPLEVTGSVLTLSDGQFTYRGGIWEGCRGEMGPTAVLQCGLVQILIASNPTYDWADEQFRSVGLDYRSARFIVVKNPMNYRTAYADVAQAAFVLDTPGPTPASVRNFEFRNLARPYFPADEEIPGLAPRIYLSAPNCG